MSEKLNYVPLPVLDDPSYMTSYLNMLTLSSVFFGKLVSYVSLLDHADQP